MLYFMDKPEEYIVHGKGKKIILWFGLWWLLFTLPTIQGQLKSPWSLHKSDPHWPPPPLTHLAITLGSFFTWNVLELICMSKPHSTGCKSPETILLSVRWCSQIWIWKAHIPPLFPPPSLGFPVSIFILSFHLSSFHVQTFKVYSSFRIQQTRTL